MSSLHYNIHTQEYLNQAKALMRVFFISNVTPRIINNKKQVRLFLNENKEFLIRGGGGNCVEF
jgi:hypothetical protein